MITKQAVEEQLKRIGCNFRFWGRSEVNELGRILMDDEIIAECTNGQYSNGFAMLVATNHRVLLVDKKPLLYLTVEDLRYDMITEFNYNHRLLDATIRIYTTNKTLVFTSWNQHRLRKLLEFAQAHVLEMRKHNHMAQQFQAAAAAQFAQMSVAQAQGQASFAPPAAVPQLPDSQAQQLAAPQPQPLPVEAQNISDAAASMQAISSRLATKRAALGTYTRSKLPSFRLKMNEHQSKTPEAESGEVYQNGYSTAQPNLPYEYES